jgi:hypothetical protein
MLRQAYNSVTTVLRQAYYNAVPGVEHNKHTRIYSCRLIHYDIDNICIQKQKIMTTGTLLKEAFSAPLF